MPVNTELTTKVWNRYTWVRDNGHSEFVEKADKCERFFRGDQWTADDLVKLRAARRPALTINKIMSTVSNVMGEQIYNRSEIAFRPRSGAPGATADVLTKVFKQISDNNQLDWKRSDMFADGIITSRGFLDVRIAFNNHMMGEVDISKINPKNVMIDPDGDDYDPDTWGECWTTKWMTADMLAVLYGKEDAELLRNKPVSYFPYGYDSIASDRDRFGNSTVPTDGGSFDESAVLRNIRVIERQHRMLDRQKHFVSQEGDMRPIPEDFTRDKIAMFVDQFGFQVITKLVSRIRWTVIADNVVLHDAWSPYKHFTVIPYFPHFRHGHTIGLVENLLGPQELLNKSTSQELHSINTTANSGWKVRTGSLTNMSVEELEQRGAETGLVVEVNGDPDKDLVKIQPSTVPSGLDRVSYKAEDHIKQISGISDSMQGQDRADVAAKAIQAKQKAGNTNLAKPLDSLVRSDFLLARNILDLVQEYYTEQRLMTITHDKTSGETQDFTINEVSPQGTVDNDLTIGEYDVVISSVPQRETLEDSQFDQAVALKELGVQIPDSVLIDASRLLNKKDIVKQMEEQANSKAAQKQQQTQEAMQQAEIAKTQAEGMVKNADAGLKSAKTEEVTAKTQVLLNTPPEQPDQGDGGAAIAKAQTDSLVADSKMSIDARKQDHQERLDAAKLEEERHKNDQAAQIAAQAQADKIAQSRIAAATAAAKPTQAK